MSRSVATKEAPRSPADDGPPLAPFADIRRSRPYLLTPTPLRSLAFRAVSLVSLLALDLLAVGMAIYAALVIRELLYGHHPIFWGILWTDAEANYFPFVALVTALVFWQAGLYAQRERRTGFGRIVSSLVVVALLVLAFGVGTGHDFTTFGLIPTSLVLTAVLIGLFRASYDAVSREALHVLGVRRRAIVVGEGEHLDHLLRMLGSVRGGIDYDFVGVVSRRLDGLDLRRLGSSTLRAVLAEYPADELIVTDSDYCERDCSQIVEHAHRSGVKVRIAPKTTELLVQRARVRPGPGRAAVRAAPAGVRGHRLGGEARLRPGRQPGRDRARAAALAADRRGDQAHLARAGLLPRPARRPRRARRSTCSSSGRCTRTRPRSRPSSSTQNEAEGALFKIRDDPRVTKVGAAAPPPLARRVAEHAQRAARRDEPRRPAAAAAARLRAARGRGTASAPSCCPA